MNQVGIVKLLNELGIFNPGSVHVRGKYMTHTCPFAPVTHRNGRDRNPSFSIMIAEEGYSYYKCWSCKIQGKLYTLKHKLSQVLENEGNVKSIREMREAEDLTIIEKPYEAPVYINQTLERPKPIDEAVYENIFVDIAESGEACNYLTSRAISSRTVNRLGIRYDDVERRIVFPVRGRDGNLYGYTGRTILQDWEEKDRECRQRGGRYPKVKDYAGLQKRFFLLNEQNLDNGKSTLVVEGLFALARMVELGVEASLNIVAVLGSSLTPPKVETLTNIGNAVYLLFDNDEAGRSGMFGFVNTRGDIVTKGAVHLLYDKVPVLVPEWPEGKKDPDELTRDELDFMVKMTYNYIITSGKS